MQDSRFSSKDGTERQIAVYEICKGICKEIPTIDSLYSFVDEAPERSLQALQIISIIGSSSDAPRLEKIKKIESRRLSAMAGCLTDDERFWEWVTTAFLWLFIRTNDKDVLQNGNYHEKWFLKRKLQVKSVEEYWGLIHL